MIRFFCNNCDVEIVPSPGRQGIVRELSNGVGVQAIAYKKDTDHNFHICERCIIYVLQNGTAPSDTRG